MSHYSDLLGPGSCGLLPTGPRYYYKIGGISVTNALERDGILEAKNMLIFPVVLRPKPPKPNFEDESTPPLKGARAETTLKETIFGQKVSFSRATSKFLLLTWWHVVLILATSSDAVYAFYDSHNPILAEVLFEDFLDRIDDVSKLMYPAIKNLVLQQISAAGIETAHGQSTEEHKEPTDKAYVRSLLLYLTGDERPLCPVVYSEEVSFKLNDDSCGPHSYINLLIGVERKANEKGVDFLLKVTSGPIIGLSNTSLGDDNASLSRSNPKPNRDGYVELL